MRVTVVIATRDRATSLDATLSRLAQSTVPQGVEWDIVVADNGSVDATPQVVARHQGVDPVLIVSVVEGTGGKSVALNRAVAVARGDIVAFTDDDGLPDPTWLAEVAREFQQDPGLAVLGGRIELADPADLPMAIRPSRERLLVTPRTYDPGYPPIIGCNMAFRRNSLIALGGFDEALGPGTPIVAEDVDVVYRACREGMKVVYSPAPLVLHRHGRRTAVDRERAMRTYLRGRGAFYAKYLRLGDWRVAAHALAELTRTLWQVAFAAGAGPTGLPPRERLALLAAGARAYPRGRRIRTASPE